MQVLKEHQILFRTPDVGYRTENLFPSGDCELIHHFLLHHRFHCHMFQDMPHLLRNPVEGRKIKRNKMLDRLSYIKGQKI